MAYRELTAEETEAFAQVLSAQQQVERGLLALCERLLEITTVDDATRAEVTYHLDAMKQLMDESDAWYTGLRLELTES